MVVARKVQSLQGLPGTCCTAGRYPGSGQPRGVEYLTRICRQANGGVFIRGTEGSIPQLKPYFSSRTPGSSSLPRTRYLLVHALQAQVAPPKGLKDSDLPTPPQNSKDASDAERSNGRRTLRAFRGGRVLPRRIDCLVSETAVAARWSDPGYAYPPAARGRTAGAANLMKSVAEEGSQDDPRDDPGGWRLDERWIAVSSEDDGQTVFGKLRKQGGGAVAKILRSRERHSDPERAFLRINSNRSYPPNVEPVGPVLGAWYPDAFVAGSSWGANQADSVKRILNTPRMAAEAKRPTIDLSETIEMFSDRATEGTFNSPSTSYSNSWDGLKQADWEAFGGSAGEEFGRKPEVAIKREPRIEWESGPEVNLQGRPKSAGLTGGVVFRMQGGRKDVWRREGRKSEGGWQGEVWERGEGFSRGKEDSRLRGAMREQGGVTEDRLKTGQRQGLLGQPSTFCRVAGETIVAGNSTVPEVEMVLGIEAGETSGESGFGAKLETQLEAANGAHFETGFGIGFADRETGFEPRLQPGLPNGGLDEELELFVERLGRLGNSAPATESSQEAVAFGTTSAQPDLGYANPEAPRGGHAQDGVRGVDRFKWRAQDRRSGTPQELSAGITDNLPLPWKFRSVETSPLETAVPVGTRFRSQTSETLTFETRRWGAQTRDNLPPASIPLSCFPSPTGASETPFGDVPKSNPSHPVGGEKQELPPTAFYDEHFLERFQYTRPPPNRNLPLFLDVKGHDTSPELPMPPPYYPRNSTHEKSGPLPGYPHGRVPRPKLPGPLLYGKRPDYWVVNPNNNKLVVPRAAKTAPRGKLPGVRKLLEGWTGRGLRTREEVLGTPLSDAEVARLVEGSVHDRREVYLGRDGLTWNMVGLIHTHWRRRPVCKVKCKGIFTVDMPKVLRELERSAGGRVIWQHCGTVLLFRGRNYHWKEPPILEPPEDRSADKKLTQETNPVEDRNPGGMGKLESLRLSRRMNREPPIIWLDKNGYYGGLVHLVRTFFSKPENDLAVIKCPEFVPGDVVKLAIQLKALVPAVVFQVDKDRKQRIVLYRNAGWKCPTDDLTRLAETDERPSYYPKGPPQKRKSLRKVVEEQLLGEEEEDEGVWGRWGSVFDAPSDDEETEEL